MIELMETIGTNMNFLHNIKENLFSNEPSMLGLFLWSMIGGLGGFILVLLFQAPIIHQSLAILGHQLYLWSAVAISNPLIWGSLLTLLILGAIYLHKNTMYKGYEKHIQPTFNPSLPLKKELEQSDPQKRKQILQRIAKAPKELKLLAVLAQSNHNMLDELTQNLELSELSPDTLNTLMAIATISQHVKQSPAYAQGRFQVGNNLTAAKALLKTHGFAPKGLTCRYHIDKNDLEGENREAIDLLLTHGIEPDYLTDSITDYVKLEAEAYKTDKNLAHIARIKNILHVLEGEDPENILQRLALEVDLIGLAKEAEDPDLQALALSLPGACCSFDTYQSLTQVEQNQIGRVNRASPLLPILVKTMRDTPERLEDALKTLSIDVTSKLYNRTLLDWALTKKTDIKTLNTLIDHGFTSYQDDEHQIEKSHIDLLISKRIYTIHHKHINLLKGLIEGYAQKPEIYRQHLKYLLNPEHDYIYHIPELDIVKIAIETTNDELLDIALHAKLPCCSYESYKQLSEEQRAIIKESDHAKLHMLFTLLDETREALADLEPPSDIEDTEDAFLTKVDELDLIDKTTELEIVWEQENPLSVNLYEYAKQLELNATHIPGELTTRGYKTIDDQSEEKPASSLWDWGLAASFWGTLQLSQEDEESDISDNEASPPLNII